MPPPGSVRLAPIARRSRVRSGALTTVVTMVATTVVLGGPWGAATAGPVHPHVTGGQPDGTSHSYVAMVTRRGVVRPSCTGVLVTADNGAPVVLTDAHCLYRDSRHTGSGVHVTFDADWSPSSPELTGRFAVDPDYQPKTHLHDVAVITLAKSAPSNPATLAPLEAGSGIARNHYLDAVGTGKPHAGHRRAATEQLTRKTSTWLYLRPGTGNTCGGDSGGPDLIRGTSTVVALTNQGTCSADQDTRLDIAVGSRAFIDKAAGLTGRRSMVSLGVRGTDSRVVRSLLGLVPGDGFGPSAQAATRGWQRAHRVPVTGVVDPATWASFGF